MGHLERGEGSQSGGERDRWPSRGAGDLRERGRRTGPVEEGNIELAIWKRLRGGHLEGRRRGRMAINGRGGGQMAI